MSYEDRYKKLGWSARSVCHDYISLVEFYKIVHDNSDNVNFNYDFFELCKLLHTRANHMFKLYVKLARINSYKHSFFIKMILKTVEQPTKRCGRI